MALRLNGSSAHLLRTGASIVSGYPFTIFMWTRVQAAQSGFAVELALDPAPGNVHHGHAIVQSGGSMQGYSTVSGTAAAVAAYASRAVSVGDWVPCMVVFSASNLRRIYYGNGIVKTSTVNVPQTPSSLMTISVGRQAIVGNYYWNGDLACLGIWNAELTEADYAQLAAGDVPATVRSASLVDYWSFLTQGATQTGLNGRVLNATNTAQAPTHPINETSSSDTVPPVLSGSLTVSNLTSTSYTLTWPSGFDDVGVISYERSLDGGSTWTNVGNVLTSNVTGRTPGATDQVQVRARDAGGNVSLPPLSTAVSLPSLPDTTAPVLSGSLTISALTTTGYSVSWPAATDNVAVAYYELSVDGGTTWLNVGNVLGASVSGRTPGATDAVRVRARDAAGNASGILGTSVTLPAPADSTAPVLSGSITVSALTTTTYTLSWPAATDNVGVTSYERSLDAGASWTSVGNVLTTNVSGRTPGSTDPVRIRARDAAGNVSTPLSTSVTLLNISGGATISTPPLKNNTGTLLANLPGITVNVYSIATGALVVRKAGLTSNAAGVVIINDPSLSAGTTYAYEVVTASNGRRLPTGLAS